MIGGIFPNRTDALVDRKRTGSAKHAHKALRSRESSSFKHVKCLCKLQLPAGVEWYVLVHSAVPWATRPSSAQGIGFALAKCFRRAGASVTILGRS